MKITEPPYTITEKATNLLLKIVEMLSHLENKTGFRRDIKLHRENRLRSIQSSCAIEGNTLSFLEVTDVISGKLLFGRQEDIQEVKNAYAAYNEILTYDPYSIDSFLKAHGLVTNGLIKETGKFRSGDVGVRSGDKIVHLGARPFYVQGLIGDLFAWAKQSDLHPVLKSSIVHFEIETIHPFADGNGRIGRLWHTLILTKWKEVFQWIPIESIINKKRPQYYESLNNAQTANDSTGFIEYCLEVIFETISLQIEQQKHRVEILTDIQHIILKTLENKSLSRKEIFANLGISGDTRSFKRNIEPLIVKGLVEMTEPDKPNSRSQRYRLTERGRKGVRSGEW